MPGWSGPACASRGSGSDADQASIGEAMAIPATSAAPATIDLFISYSPFVILQHPRSCNTIGGRQAGAPRGCGLKRVKSLTGLLPPERENAEY
jgi:hypothetical protein